MGGSGRDGTLVALIVGGLGVGLTAKDVSKGLAGKGRATALRKRRRARRRVVGVGHGGNEGMERLEAERTEGAVGVIGDHGGGHVRSCDDGGVGSKEQGSGRGPGDWRRRSREVDGGEIDR